MAQEGLETVDKLTGEDSSDKCTLPRLPEEIWEKILMGNLSSSDDFRSTARTCSDWKRILYPKRIFWQFPEVFPLLLKYIGKKDVLNCRLVCKSWAQGVDEYLDSEEISAPYTECCHGSIDLSRTLWGQGQQMGEFPYNFGIPYIDDIDYNYHPRELLLDMRLHPRNPFIGRAVSLTYRNDNYNDTPWDAMNEFQSAFGRHISYLDLTFSEHTQKHLLVMTVHATVENMPNLVQLRIAAKCHFRKPESIRNNSEAIFIEYFKNNVMKIPQLPLRRLKMLTLLLDFTGDLSSPSYHFIMEYFPKYLLQTHSNQLRRLEVNHWNSSYSALDWTSLTELRLSVRSCRELKNGNFSAPNLTKLSITVSGLMRPTPSKYEEEPDLINVLRLCPSLKRMSIFYNDKWIERDIPDIGMEICPKAEVYIDDLKASTFPSLIEFSINSVPASENILNLFPYLEILSLVKLEKCSQDETSKPPCLRYTGTFPKYENFCAPQILNKICTLCFECDDFQREHWNWWRFRVFPKMQRDDEASNCNYKNHLTVSRFLSLFSQPSLQCLTIGGEVYSRNQKVIESTPRPSLDEQAKDTDGAEIPWHYWDWNDFDYEFSMKLQKRFSFCHFIELDADSPSFATADFWMNKVAEFNQLFPTVEIIRFSHSPVLKRFLLCFPNVKQLNLPSTEGVGHYFSQHWRDRIVYDSCDLKQDSFQEKSLIPEAYHSITKSEVWELLPSLQKIQLYTIDNESYEEDPDNVVIIRHDPLKNVGKKKGGGKRPDMEAAGTSSSARQQLGDSVADSSTPNKKQRPTNSSRLGSTPRCMVQRTPKKKQPTARPLWRY